MPHPFRLLRARAERPRRRAAEQGDECASLHSVGGETGGIAARPIADRFHDPGHVSDTRTNFEVDLVVPIRLAETVCMTVAGEYRRNALQCWQRASESICVADKATWLKLAQEWQRLAERVDPGTALSYNYGAGAKNFHSNRSLSDYRTGLSPFGTDIEIYRAETGVRKAPIVRKSRPRDSAHST